MTAFVRHPVDNPVISQPFGAPNDWENPPWHKGIDYAAPAGTPIYAPCDGFVVWASGQPFGYGNTWEMIPGSGNSGNCVIIQPPAPHTSLQTSFSHMSGITVSAGQWVTAGALIGYVGNTGFSFGAHLHWEAFIDYAEGSYPAGTFYGRVNPLDYFSTATVVPIGTGGKGSTTPAQEEIVPNQSDKVFDAIDGSKVSLNELLNSIDRKQDQQGKVLVQLAGALEQNMKLTAGILTTRIADPSDPKKTYTIADYIVGGATNAKYAAGNSGKALENTSPEALAKAVREGAAAVSASDIADQLSITIKQEGAK